MMLLINLLDFSKYLLLSTIICISSIGYYNILIFIHRKIYNRSNLIKNLPITIHFVFGISIQVFILSYLSLFGYANNTAINFLILLGLLFSFKSIRHFYKKIRIPQYSNIFSLFFLICMMWFLFLITINFNVHDDFHAYLVLPKMLLDSGGLLTHSFLERGLYSLGGSSIAQAIFLSQLPLDMARMFESICLVMTFIFSLDLANHFKQKQRNIFILFVIFLFYLNIPISNTSSVFSSTLWISVIIFLCYINYTYPVRYINLVLTITTTAFISLLITFKHINIPTALAAFTIFNTITYNKMKNTTKFIKYFLVQLFTTISVLLPFLVINYINYDTPIFPMMGLGNHRAAYTDQPRLAWNPSALELIKFVSTFFPNHWRTLTISVILLFVLIKLYKNISVLNKKYSNYIQVIFIFTIVVTALRIFVAYKAWGDAVRHTYNLDLALFVMFIPIFHHLYRVTGSILTLIAIAVFISPHNFIKYLDGSIESNLYFLFKPKVITPIKNITHLDKHRIFPENNYALEIQNLIPANEKVFLFVSKPFLFDYSRNPIYPCDSGAMVSPKPHIPFNQPSEELVHYFKQIGIKYAIYSKDEINYGIETYRDRLKSEHPLIKWYTILVFDLINQFRELVKRKAYTNENQEYYLFHFE